MGRVGGGRLGGLGARPIERVLAAVEVAVILVRDDVDVDVFGFDVGAVVELVFGLDARLCEFLCGRKRRVLER